MRLEITTNLLHLRAAAVGHAAPILLQQESSTTFPAGRPFSSSPSDEFRSWLILTRRASEDSTHARETREKVLQARMNVGTLAGLATQVEDLGRVAGSLGSDLGASSAGEASKIDLPDLNEPWWSPSLEASAEHLPSAKPPSPPPVLLPPDGARALIASPTEPLQAKHAGKRGRSDESVPGDRPPPAKRYRGAPRKPVPEGEEGAALLAQRELSRVSRQLWQARVAIKESKAAPTMEQLALVIDLTRKRSAAADRAMAFPSNKAKRALQHRTSYLKSKAKIIDAEGETSTPSAILPAGIAPPTAPQ